MSASRAAKPPSLLNLMMESRAIFELGWFYGTRNLMAYLPKGDGHPVIVLPGFVASDGSTRPLRGVLSDLGYATHGWGLGRNLEFTAEREQMMRDLVRNVADEAGEKVSLIGWSLGGVFARELAKAFPEKVRAVITLGSPITGDQKLSNARHLFSAINGKAGHMDEKRFAKLAEPPPVPTTSIYSKTDGVVAWRGSVQKKDAGATLQVENIEVPASHFGMGVNPIVVYAIADRLAQAEGEWAPFDRGGLRRFFFNRPESE